MQLLKWWITILDTLSPADAAVWSILGAAIVVLLCVIGRWCVAFWRYTPEEEARPIPQPPRQPPSAPGLKRAHRRVS